MLIRDNVSLMENSDMTNTFLYDLRTLGFISYINKITRYSSGIDHCFVEYPTNCFQYNPFNFETDITDHFFFALQRVITEIKVKSLGIS